MSEVFKTNYEDLKTNEGNNKNVTPSFNDARSKIGREAILFYGSNKDSPEAVGSLRRLLQRQEQERKLLLERQKENTFGETKEALDNEALIHEAKTMLYEKMGISENLKDNSSLENFLKGIVDELILGNYELALQVWETNGKVVLDSLAQLISLEGIMQVAIALGESVGDLFTGNAYEKGKSVAELGLVATGVGLSVAVGKKGVKLLMRKISKLRANKENLVSSSGVKGVIQETNNRVASIIPKREVNFSSEVINKLPENIRKLDLDLKNYPQKQLDGLKQRLGLDSKASMNDVDLTLRLKIKDALEMYKERGRENLMRIGNDLVEDMRKLGIENPQLEIRNEIRRLKSLKKDEDIIIITAFGSDKKGLVKNGGLKSAYQANEIPFNGADTYGKMRESGDKGMKIYGLDPKYATMIIERKDFKFLVENYKFDNYIQHSFNELKGRSGATYYDSILTGRIDGNGLTSQMIDFDYILEAQALLNIEKKYKNIGKLEQLKNLSISENGLKEINAKGNVPMNTKMIRDIKPFIEIQIFGKVGQNKKIHDIPNF